VPDDDAEPGDRVYVDRAQDHVGTARLAYADERIYDWLLARRHPNRGSWPIEPPRAETREGIGP
jgi:hypothetical protein